MCHMSKKLSAALNMLLKESDGYRYVNGPAAIDLR